MSVGNGISENLDYKISQRRTVFYIPLPARMSTNFPQTTIEKFVK